MSTDKTILVIGLAPGPTHNWDSSAISAALARTDDYFAVHGFTMALFEVEPTDPSVLEKVEVELRRKAWTGVSLGYGLRATAEFTWLFERLVNMAVRGGSEPPRLVFPMNPDDIIEAAKREFPELRD